MSYDTLERSAAQGRPVELYEFQRESFYWRHTSADRDLVVDFQTYTALAIRRSGIEQGSELNRSNLRLTIPASARVLEQYRAGPPSDAVTLLLRQYHEGSGQLAVIWSGRVVSVSTWRDGQAEMVLEPVYTSLRRTGLRRVYQRQCPHVLYGPACGVNPAAYRAAGEVGQINGAVIQASILATQPAGYYSGGFIEWEIAPGTFERRFIVSHSGANAELNTIPVGLAVGGTVRIYPGCARDTTDCQGKFNNLANYGGMPYLPLKNPFGNEPMY